MALVDLRLAPEVFWALTFRELDLLMRRRREVLEREVDFPAKLVSWFLLNINRDHAQHPEPIPFAEVFPEKTPEEMTPEEIADMWMKRARALTAMFGGEDLTKPKEET